MRHLIAAAAASLLALQAVADPRLGTKACVVENARVFDPYTGYSGQWLKPQKSFVLNVYTCAEVWRRKLDMGWSENCNPADPEALTIKTTLEMFTTGWDHASGFMQNAEGKAVLIPAEFRSSLAYADEFNRPILRLYPDLHFEFVRLGAGDGAAQAGWTLTGTCADFQ